MVGSWLFLGKDLPLVLALCTVKLILAKAYDSYLDNQGKAMPDFSGLFTKDKGIYVEIPSPTNSSKSRKKSK